MNTINPASFIADYWTDEEKPCDFFGFSFNSYYEPDIWDQLLKNFYIKTLYSLSKIEGLNGFICPGCIGEVHSPTAFMISDLECTNLLVQLKEPATRFSAGTLVLLNCPKIVPYQKTVKLVIEDNNVIIIGHVTGFAICDKYGSHLDCVKYIDKSKKRLCSFHESYYRLKLKMRSPLSFPISTHPGLSSTVQHQV